jgi:hypothetical protein
MQLTSFKQIVQATLLCVTVAGILAALTPSSAQAASPRASDIWDCYHGTNPYGSQAICYSGYGSVRAWVECDPGWWLPNYRRYGDWVNVGRWSYAECDEPTHGKPDNGYNTFTN